MTVALTRSHPAGTGLRRLGFGAAPEGHARPGQYVVVSVGASKPGFFAIASSPGEPLELLVKAVGETGEALCRLEPGAHVEVSEARGVGFPLERVAGLPLVVLVNGSGISAARPVILAEIAAGLSRPVHLFYGVLTPAHRSFLDDLEAWAAAGVEVTTVVDASGVDGWEGPTGYVQDVAAEHGLCRPGVGVVLVGHQAMVDAARARWLAAGADPQHLLLNF